MRRASVCGVVALCAAAVVAEDLKIETVAPEEALLVVQIDGFSEIVEGLQAAGVVEDEDLDAFRDGLRQSLDELPSEHVEPWKHVFEDGDPIEIMADLSMGLVLWPESNTDGPPTLHGVAWVDLGEQAQVLGPVFEEEWSAQRESADVTTEDVAGRQVDVLPIGLVDPEAAPDGLPTTIQLLLEDRWVIMASSTEAMQRVLNVLDDTPDEDQLGEASSWHALHGMLGEDHTIVGAIFIEPMFETAKIFDTMGVSQMARQSFDPSMGGIRGVGFSAGAGEGETAVDWQAAIWMPEGPAGLIGLFSTNSDVGPIPAWVGPDVVDFSRYNVEYKSIIPWLRSVIASNPMMMGMGQIIDEMEPTAKALLDPLGMRTLSTKSLTRPLTPESVSEVMWVSCKNAQSLSDALSETAPKTGLKPQEFQGHQVWSAPESGGMGMPGMSMEDMSLSVTPSGLFVGGKTGVEAALRAVGDRGGSAPAWLERVRDWLPSGELAAWGGTDLAESLTAMVEVQDMRVSQWEREIAQSDPELWEEIRGELVDEASHQRNERFAAMARRLGPSAWWAASGPEGIRLSGAILASDALEPTSSPASGTSP